MLQVSGNYENIWYHSAEAKDADYNSWFFRIDSSGGWRLTPNWTMVPSVYYLNTTNSSRRSQQVPSGDPVLPPVTIINYGNTDSEDIGAAVNLNYLATPNLTIGVNGNYSEQRYSDAADNTSGSGLTNSKQTGGNASVSYLFSPRTSLGILVAGNHQTYENAPDSDTLSGGILFGYQFSPVLRLDGVFGMSYIRQNEAPGIPEQRTSSPSGTLQYHLHPRDVHRQGVWIVHLFRGERVRRGHPAKNHRPGVYRPVHQGVVRKPLRHLSSQPIGLLGRMPLILSQSDGTAGLSYRAWEWASLDLTGNLNRQTSNGQFGDALDNYSALLGITIGKPYKIY